MLITIKFFACYGVKFSKNTPIKNFKQGGAFAQGFSIVPWFSSGIFLKNLLSKLLYWVKTKCVKLLNLFSIKVIFLMYVFVGIFYLFFLWILKDVYIIIYVYILIIFLHETFLGEIVGISSKFFSHMLLFQCLMLNLQHDVYTPT